MGERNPATDKWIKDVLAILPPGPAASPGAANLTDAQCVELIKGCGSDWKKVKDTYVPQPEIMRALLAFRTKLTNGFLKMLGAQSGGRLVAKADGSTSLTSDIDVTVGSTDSSGIEIDAIVSFNDEIKRMFGKSPGIALDVNLYARDFFGVTDKIINPDGEPRRDPEAMAAIDAALAAEDRSDQDVAALMKQRQYMPVDEWLGYKAQVMAGLEKIPDKDARAKAIKENTVQFEEAENLYLMNATDKVKRFFEHLDKTDTGDLGVPPKAAGEMSMLRAKWEEMLHNSDDVRATEKLPELVDEILALGHEHFDNVAMEANNEGYMEKVSGVRDVQTRHKALTALIQVYKELKAAREGGDAANIPSLEAKLKAAQDAATPPGGKPIPEAEINEDLEAQVKSLKAKAKKDTAEANFYASEAYLSEGPLQHIVNGNQAGNPEVLAKLKPEHFLGSINEQFGDFMKDVGHYKGDDGQGFCQTSKYLQRLLEGIGMLTDKPEFKDVKFATITNAEAKSVSAAIKEKLVPIRKAEGEWGAMSDEERFAKALSLAEDVYGVSSMAELTSLFKQVTADVNAVVRAALTAQGGMRAGKEEMAAYMKGAAPKAA